MKIGKLILGIVLVVVSFLVVFVPASFEFLEKIISFQTIQGVGLVFIGVGIVGFIIIINSLSN